MNNRGFTLVEMLVSVAIFTVVMVIALGALLSLSAASRKVQTINTAVNNLSFAVDSMSRLIRTGLNYHCGASGTMTQGQDCTIVPQPYIAFQVVDGSLNGCVQGSACEVVYCLSSEGSTDTCNSSISCTAGSSCSLLRQICVGGFCEEDDFAPITSSEVSVSSLSFYVIGAASGDNIQPKVTMLISGIVPVTATKSTVFNLQTS
ncbi:MAG: type II secretion system protein, partial [bacterium]|nr:type II secretion system protein [bacterium]